VSAFDPVRLVAEVEVYLHQHGIATLAGGGVSAVTAAQDLLRALGVDPVDEHRPVLYRVELVEAVATAATVEDAEDFAHALRTTDRVRSGRASVAIEAVAAARPLVGA
jgi:hypothetical protein